MSLRDYMLSAKLEEQGDWVEDFYALIMLAIRNADDENKAKLRAAWPDVYDEFVERYNAPQALLPGEGAIDGWHRDDAGNLYAPDGKIVRAETVNRI